MQLRLAVILLFGAFLSACSQEETQTAPDPDKLQVSLMFHFNQDLVPYALAADMISYERLVSTLLEFPEVPVQIHVSGTLLHMLQWSESETLSLLKKGVDSGQFELLQSTYSQNIIYATLDSLLNSTQIRMHKDLLDHHFGAETPGFWNAERVWSRDVAETIAAHGDLYVPVESHILFESGLDSLDRQAWRYSTDAGPITIIHDDAIFRAGVNHVFNTGELEPLDEYLISMRDAHSGRNAFISFHEDAEAAGLWQFEGGAHHPDETMEHVRSLLRYLSETEWIEPTVPSRYISAVDLQAFPGEIVKGEAKWMTEFSQGMGYDSWFGYLENDPLKTNIMSVFDELKPDVQQMAANTAELDNAHPARILFEKALQFYAAYSYELGASWYWTGNDAGFHRARDLRFLLFAAGLAQSGYEHDIILKDLNGDGVSEIAWIEDGQLIILQKEEARMLYWIDLESGELLLDNSWAYYYDEDWKPGNYSLAELRGGSDVYPWLAGNELMPEIFEETYLLRSTGPVLQDDAGHVFTYQTPEVDSEQRSVLWKSDDEEFPVKLTLRWDKGPLFTWEIQNNEPLLLSQAFAIEPALMLTHGPDALHHKNGRWQNQISGTTIHYELNPKPENYSKDNVLFGKRMQFDLAPAEPGEGGVWFRVWRGGESSN